jgi:protein dithiol oxidoreductase (disulfide-forming)
MLKRLSLVCVFMALASLALAQGRPLPGRDYMELPTPQATETGAKIEVVEFFWYRCPHCHALDPLLAPWVKKLPADAQFRLVPAIFNDEWALDARIFYALEATGYVDRLHHPLLDAIHTQNAAGLKGQAYLKWVSSWLSKQGVDIAKYDAAFKSFTVDSKVKRAFQIAQAYRLEGVPALAVQGRYLVSGEGKNMLGTADFLISQIRGGAGKK